MRTGFGIRAALLTLVVGVSTVACVTPSRSVQRTAADQQTDLSGRWNDTDARLTAEEMIDDVLSRPWLDRFVGEESREPVVVVGRIRNLSSEHIDTTGLVRDIERELINSGLVRFVAGGDQRSDVREERMDQQSQATEDSIARLGAETGADYMLQGSITSTVDAIEGERAIFYQVDMELIDIETNEKVWIGSKEIKKLVEQRRARF